MSKSRFVQQIEEERKFLRLYHEEGITALNISRLLDFTPGQVHLVPSGSSVSYGGQGFYAPALSKELKDVYQVLRKSSFLSHFTYQSSDKAHIAQQHAWSQLSSFSAATVSGLETTKVLAARHSLLFQHETLIRGLTANTYLTHVDLGKMFMGNELAKEFSKIFLLNKIITYLDLSHNVIQEQGGLAIATNLTNYQSLTHLDFSNNQIALSIVQKLAEALATNGNLTFLNLSQTASRYISAGADDAIGTIVAVNKNLSHLDIANIPLTTKEIVIESKEAEEVSSTETSVVVAPKKKTINSVLSALEESVAMKYVNISHCLTSNPALGATVIASLLAHNTNITEINISSNNLQATGLSQIADALVHNTRLRVLDISNNQLGEYGGDVIATILLRNHSITKLSASSNELGYGGVKPIANALKNNTSLLEVTIASNNLDEAGGLLIGKALEQNRTLTMLDLSGNTIEAVGAMYIAQALRDNHHLKHLNLSNNRIVSTNQQTMQTDYRGIEALSGVISALVTLDLSNNAVNAKAAEFLAIGLKGNNTLVSLCLKSNPLTYEGVKAVVDAITGHHHLLKLDLSATNMTDQGVLHLFNALQHNLSIADLDISMNNLTSSGAVHVVSLLQHNISITKLKINQVYETFVTLSNGQTQHQTLLAFENAILPGINASSLIELSETSDLSSGQKLFFEVSKHNDVLQSNLRKLETEEGQNFDTKLLFVLLKQLQGRSADSIPAEISYADMKSSEFYIRKIAEIFNTKHFQPAEQVRIVEVEAVPVVEATETAAPNEQLAETTPPDTAPVVADHVSVAHDIYFDALVDGGLLGYLDVPTDSYE